MKIKVLKYGVCPRHNDVVSGTVEVEKINERLYVRHYAEEDRYSKTERIDMILALSDKVYVMMGEGYPKEKIQEQTFIKSYTELAVNFKERYLAAAGMNRHIPLLIIRAFGELGYDTAELWRSRKEYAKQKSAEKLTEEAAKQAREAEQVEIKRQQEKEENQRLDKVKEDFLAGESITGNDFLNIAKRDGLEIHIRTSGTIRKSVIGLNRKGEVRVLRGRHGWPKVSGCHKAIDAYLKIMDNHEEQ